jgi:hypothetical protein
MINMIFKRKGLSGHSLLVMLLVMLSLSSFPSASALNQETISRRDLVIDLGEGLTTDAQLTFPAVGDGPFPGVLLIHGSGNTDMDEYFPSMVTGTGEPSRPFLQIAEYLSERGFAVLRYNKRAIGLNGTMLNVEVYLNATFQILKQDAETALDVLTEQEEVDPNDITLIGHSEGAMIAPRIATENPNIRKIVLLSAVAHNLRDILEYQIVDSRVSYAEKVIDTNKDGVISIQEVISIQDWDILLPIPPIALIENSTGEWLWLPGTDLNGDGVMSIHEEFQTRQLYALDIVTIPEFPTSIWFRSHFELNSTLSMIGNVSCSTLILQGEDDAQTPLQEAFLLEQRLTQTKNPDHTLKSYPGLGHSFYPVDGWKQPLGPIQDHVLSDIAAWLNDPARKMHYLYAQLQTAEIIIDALQGQLGDLNSELEQQTSELKNLDVKMQSGSTNMLNAIADLESRNVELQSALYSSRNLTYIALGTALLAVLAVAMLLNRARI